MNLSLQWVVVCFEAEWAVCIRDQREWVFEVREVKSENKKLSLSFEKCKVKKMLSLFFEKCKVKSKCFHSFSRSEKWNQNASRSRSRSENSREFLTILEKRDFWTDLFRESQVSQLKQMACSWGNNHEHFHNLTILKSESSLTKLLYCRPISLLNPGNTS